MTRPILAKLSTEALHAMLAAKETEAADIRTELRRRGEVSAAHGKTIMLLRDWLDRYGDRRDPDLGAQMDELLCNRWTRRKQ